jgi:hypothetical protein
MLKALSEPYSGADPGEFELTFEWLVSRPFVFRVEAGVLSRSLRFEPDGRISGYNHPNESAWTIENGELHILNADNKATCVLSFCGRRNGLVSLAGPFIDTSRAAAPTRHMHYIEEKAATGLTKIATFDLFDTLVARRCYDPLRVFQAVERQTGVHDFSRLRHKVEMDMFGRQLYGLDDIYLRLQETAGWSEAVASRLKMLELAEEWENLYPIAEVIALVGPDDVIVSDMYLPQDFVRRIIEEKCGLPGRRLLLTNYGKHLGVIWPKLLAEHEIARHYGDNPHADVASPNRFGIETQHIIVSRWTRGEQILVEVGLRDHAQAIRQARLSTCDRDPNVHGVEAAQLEFNLPLLVIGSLYVLAKARLWQADRVLMCARDCNLWSPLMRVMAQGSSSAPTVRYIRASRKLFNSESREYEAYCFSHFGGRNLLVDVVGTGQSPARFIQRLGVDQRVRPLLVVGEPEIDVFGGLKVESLTKRPFVPTRLVLEALNTSLDGTATAAKFVNYAIEIETAPNEFSPAVRHLIAAMREAFGRAVEIIRETADLRVSDDLAPETLSQAADAILALVPNHWEAINPIVREQLQHLQ